jgi:hypothetical protein
MKRRRKRQTKLNNVYFKNMSAKDLQLKILKFALAPFMSHLLFHLFADSSSPSLSLLPSAIKWGKLFNSCNLSSQKYFYQL